MGLTEEVLFTVAALHEGHSSLNIEIDDDRGQGSIDLIHFFQELSEEGMGIAAPAECRMSILSGSAYVYFDGTYRLTESEDGRRFLAFNQENSLYLPPSKKSVRPMRKAHFPGTIISIKFPVDATLSSRKRDELQE